MKRRVIVVGSINMDIVVGAEKLPAPGETVMGHQVRFIPGGKGSNQAVAARRLGAKVDLFCKVGNDAFGEMLARFLKKEGLRTDFIAESKKTHSGMAIVGLDKKGENAIVVIPGSNYELSRSEVKSIPINPTDIVVSQFEVPKETVKSLLQKARKRGALTILNPSPIVGESKELTKLADYLIINETEAAALSGGAAPKDWSNALKQAKAIRTNRKQTIIITLGSKGLICLADKAYRLNGLKVRAVDTTGAGDCFVGAFATALSEGMKLNDALNFANHAAALSVQNLGATTSFPGRRLVEKSMKKTSTT
jgi:ribokinase